MYLRDSYGETHLPTLRKFIRENSLGVLTTALPSKNFPLIQASHIPWVLEVKDEKSETELGVLRGHIARTNPQAKVLLETVAAANPTQSQSSEPVAHG